MGFGEEARAACGIGGLCVAAAVLYGLLHDQVTIRISLAYFTVGHPSLGLSSPTLIAAAWGVLATWWVGLAVGVLVAAAARVGPWPTLGPRALWAPVLAALGVMALAAAVAGIAAQCEPGACRYGWPAPPLPDEDQPGYMIAWATHRESYTSGILASLGVAVWALARRRRLASEERAEGQRPAGAAARLPALMLLPYAVLMLLHPVVQLLVGGVYGPQNGWVSAMYAVAGVAALAAASVGFVLRSRSRLPVQPKA